VYLRSSLEKDSGQVLWDYTAETTASLSKMIKVLKERFGEANQSDEYRFELKSRRRQPNETLQNLHSDVDLEIDRVERIDSTRMKIDRLDRFQGLFGHPTVHRSRSELKSPELACNKSTQLHVAFIGHSLQHHDLTDCSDTCYSAAVGAQSVLGTCSPVRLFTLELVN